MPIERWFCGYFSALLTAERFMLSGRQQQLKQPPTAEEQNWMDNTSGDDMAAEDRTS